MTYTSQMIRGSFVMIVGLALAAVFAYIFRLYLARNLSVVEFGLFYAVFSVVWFLTYLQELGLNQAVVRYISQYRAQKKYSAVSSAIVSVFLFQFIFSLVIVAIGWLLAQFLAVHYFHSEDAALLLKLLLLYLPISALLFNIASFFRGFKSQLLGFVQLGINFLVLAFVVLLLDVYGVVGVALSYLFGGLLLSVIFLWPVFARFNFFKYKPRNAAKIFKEIFFFGLPLIAVTASIHFMGLIDTLILTYFDSLTSVAVYNVVLPTVMILMVIANGLGAFLLPVVSELWTKRKTAKISNGVSILYRYTLVGSIPIILGLFAYAEFFLTIFFGQEFAVGATAFRILLIGVIGKFFLVLNGHVLSGIGRPKDFLFPVVAGLGVNILLNFLLIPFYSIEGAAVATLISFYIALFLSSRKVKQFIHFKKIFTNIASLAACSVLFLLIVELMNAFLQINPYLDMVLASVIASAAYFTCTLLFKVIDLSEIHELMRQSKIHE